MGRTLTSQSDPVGVVLCVIEILGWRDGSDEAHFKRHWRPELLDLAEVLGQRLCGMNGALSRVGQALLQAVAEGDAAAIYRDLPKAMAYFYQYVQFAAGRKKPFSCAWYRGVWGINISLFVPAGGGHIVAGFRWLGQGAYQPITLLYKADVDWGKTSPVSDLSSPHDEPYPLEWLD